ncbi:MAG: hypothetical protein BZ134_00115 [Methanosphaera sp. SHI1033]|nr:MAG: hypothetical protein BZ134_00115 [Methanosphaera sp. SHI1033]
MNKNVTKDINYDQFPDVDDELEQKYVNGGGVLSTPNEIHLILLSNRIIPGKPLSISRKAEMDIILTPETAEQIGQLLISEAQKYKKSSKN